MKRSTIHATLLLLSVLALSACQKEAGKSAKARARGETRMAKAGIVSKSVQDQQKAGDQSQDDTIDDLIDGSQDIGSEVACTTSNPELCNSIRTIVGDDGSIKLTTEKTAQATATPFKIEAAADKSQEQTVKIPKIEAKNSKRVLYVLLASEGKNDKLDELASAIKLPRTEIKRSTSIADGLDSSDNTLRALLNDTNNHFLLVTARLDDAAKLKKQFSDKMFEGRTTEQPVNAATEAYQLETRILEQLGSVVYLNYALPVKKSELESVSLSIGGEQAQKETDFEVVETNNGAVLRILNRAIIKSVNDEIVIKFKAKATSDEPRPANNGKELSEEELNYAT